MLPGMGAPYSMMPGMSGGMGGMMPGGMGGMMPGGMSGMMPGEMWYDYQLRMMASAGIGFVAIGALVGIDLAITAFSEHIIFPGLLKIQNGAITAAFDNDDLKREALSTGEIASSMLAHHEHCATILQQDDVQTALRDLLSNSRLRQNFQQMNVDPEQLLQYLDNTNYDLSDPKIQQQITQIFAMDLSAMCKSGQLHEKALYLEAELQKIVSSPAASLETAPYILLRPDLKVDTVGGTTVSVKSNDVVLVSQLEVERQLLEKAQSAEAEDTFEAIVDYLSVRSSEKLCRARMLHEFATDHDSRQSLITEPFAAIAEDFFKSTRVADAKYSSAESLMQLFSGADQASFYSTLAVNLGASVTDFNVENSLTETQSQRLDELNARMSATTDNLEDFNKITLSAEELEEYEMLMQLDLEANTARNDKILAMFQELPLSKASKILQKTVDAELQVWVQESTEQLSNEARMLYTRSPEEFESYVENLRGMFPELSKDAFDYESPNCVLGSSRFSEILMKNLQKEEPFQKGFGNCIDKEARKTRDLELEQAYLNLNAEDYSCSSKEAATQYMKHATGTDMELNTQFVEVFEDWLKPDSRFQLPSDVTHLDFDEQRELTSTLEDAQRTITGTELEALSVDDAILLREVGNLGKLESAGIKPSEIGIDVSAIITSQKTVDEFAPEIFTKLCELNDEGQALFTKEQQQQVSATIPEVQQMLNAQALANGVPEEQLAKVDEKVPIQQTLDLDDADRAYAFAFTANIEDKDLRDYLLGKPIGSDIEAVPDAEYSELRSALLHTRRDLTNAMNFSVAEAHSDEPENTCAVSLLNSTNTETSAFLALQGANFGVLRNREYISTQAPLAQQQINHTLQQLQPTLQTAEDFRGIESGKLDKPSEVYRMRQYSAEKPAEAAEITSQAFQEILRLQKTKQDLLTQLQNDPDMSAKKRQKLVQRIVDEEQVKLDEPKYLIDGEMYSLKQVSDSLVRPNLQIAQGETARLKKQIRESLEVAASDGLITSDEKSAYLRAGEFSERTLGYIQELVASDSVPDSEHGMILQETLETLALDRTLVQTDRLLKQYEINGVDEFFNDETMIHASVRIAIDHTRELFKTRITDETMAKTFHETHEVTKAISGATSAEHARLMAREASQTAYEKTKHIATNSKKSTERINTSEAEIHLETDRVLQDMRNKKKQSKNVAMK